VEIEAYGKAKNEVKLEENDEKMLKYRIKVLSYG
jgi:hypothetical protein